MRSASDHNSDRTTFLPTQLVALEPRLPAKESCVRQKRPIAREHWLKDFQEDHGLGLKAKVQPVMLWLEAGSFFPCSWLVSSFLKGDLNSRPPHLFQFEKAEHGPGVTCRIWQEKGMTTASVSEDFAYLILPTLSNRTLIFIVRSNLSKLESFSY